MTVNVSGSWQSVWDGTWWDTQQGGSTAVQQGGHGDPQNRPAVQCTGCHNIGDPPGTHLDGTYNSLGTEHAMPANANTPRARGRWFEPPRVQAPWNTNNAHLKPEYFTKYPANGLGTYRYQVAVDNYCTSECHLGAPNNVKEMRHERDTAPADADHNAVLFGTHLTVADGYNSLNVKLPAAGGNYMNYPIDLDLTTNAALLGPYYAPCVACHDPHGSTSTDTKGSKANSSNRMLRDQFQTKTADLCVTCHI
jgi:hypothetical protein